MEPNSDAILACLLANQPVKVSAECPWQMDNQFSLMGTLIHHILNSDL